MNKLSGVIFEPKISRLWNGNKEGAHYNIYCCNDGDGMEALRTIFPDGQAND